MYDRTGRSVYDMSRVTTAPIQQLEDLERKVNDDKRLNPNEKNMLVEDIKSLSSHIQSQQDKLERDYFLR